MRLGPRAIYDADPELKRVVNLIASGALSGGDPELKRVVNLIASGALSGGDPDRYAGLVGQLLNADPYLVLADFSDYLAAQDRAGACHQVQHQWTRMSILNTAGMGFFSSDRAVAEYAREVWDIQPVAPIARE